MHESLREPTITEDEVAESWVSWIQRTTHEVEDIMGKLKAWTVADEMRGQRLTLVVLLSSQALTTHAHAAEGWSSGGSSS